MNVTILTPDPAAEFAAAKSLHEFASKRADTNGNNLSEAYSGGDEFLRQCMRVGRSFELWACDHVMFDALFDVWPYLLEDKFGAAAVDVANGECRLDQLGPDRWPLIAAKLDLPLLT